MIYALDFVGRHFGAGVMAFNGVQAAVTHIQSHNPKVFEMAYKARCVYQIFSVGAIFWSGFKLVGVVATRFDLPENVVGTFGYLGIVLFSIAAVVQINQYFRPKDDPKVGSSIPVDDPNVTVRWSHPIYQVNQQGLYVLQLVTSVALVCFSNSPAFFGLNAAFLAYSLLKTSQWKWLRLERTFHCVDNGGEGPLSFAISYFISLIPSAKQSDDCSICLDKKVLPTSHFCREHTFHHHCLVNMAYTKCKDIFENMKYARSIVAAFRHGFITDWHPKYVVTINKSKIPNCPDCRRQPAQNEVHVLVKDRYQKSLSERYAHVKWVEA